jgi:hypothetical protein
MVPALVLLIFYFTRWPAIFRKKKWDSFLMLQAGAGIGVLMMLLHSLLDFNLHIPANLGYFAFLSAVFFHNYVPREPIRDRIANHERIREKKDVDTVRCIDIPKENMINPFTDKAI